MPKPLAASEKVMVEYLKELLTEDLERDISEKVVLKPVENLLAQVGEDDSNIHLNEAYLKQLEQRISSRQRDGADTEVSIEHVLEQSKKIEWNKDGKQYRQGRFQALFFEVAGLTVAVPLIELGGIHLLSQINNLLGKPDWFMGVMLYKEQQISVVDTAKWVMPEKYNQDLKNSLNYQYIIMLNESDWGLCAEKLVNTVTLDQDDVKWRDSPGKRPWLAGLVKEHMCALIDVDSLIALLDQGQSVNQTK